MKRLLQSITEAAWKKRKHLFPSLRAEWYRHIDMYYSATPLWADSLRDKDKLWSINRPHFHLLLVQVLTQLENHRFDSHVVCCWIIFKLQRDGEAEENTTETRTHRNNKVGVFVFILTGLDRTGTVQYRQGSVKTQKSSGTLWHHW